MYCPLYLYSDYCEKLHNIDIIKEQTTDKICIICWLPSDQHNHIKPMKEFSHIYLFCNCNVLIHTNCFNEWLRNCPSCPICRKKIKILTKKHLSNYIKSSIITLFMFLLNYSYKVLRIATTLYIFNVSCVIIYNTYIIFYFKHHYQYSEYEDYR